MPCAMSIRSEFFMEEFISSSWKKASLEDIGEFNHQMYWTRTQCVQCQIHVGFTARLKKVTDMQYQHIGHRIKGFYKIANFASKIKTIMNTTAQQKYDALILGGL